MHRGPACEILLLKQGRMFPPNVLQDLEHVLLAFRVLAAHGLVGNVVALGVCDMRVEPLLFEQ